jgi:hypothetical protein
MLLPMNSTARRPSIREHIQRRRLLPVAAAILLVAGGTAVSAAEIDGNIAQGEYANQLTLANGDFLLFWELDGDRAHFGIRARTGGWVALGFEPTRAMADADMIFGWVVPGEGTSARDCYSTGLFGPHPRDQELGGTQNILTSAGKEEGGLTTFEFSRALVTADPYDKPLPRQGKIRIIWAYGGSDDYLQIHSRKGSTSITLDGAQATDPGGGASPGTRTLLYWVHGSFMSVSFLMLLVGMLFPRYFKRKRWWLKSHRRIGIAGTVIGVAGIAVAVYMVRRTAGVHLRVVHSWFGLATIILLVFSPFFGHFMLKIRKVPRRAKQARAAHRWIGRTALLAMAATIVLGLRQAGIL